LLFELGEMATIDGKLGTLIAVRLLPTVRFGGKGGDDRREIDLGERARRCEAPAALGRARAVEGSDWGKSGPFEDAAPGGPKDKGQALPRQDGSIFSRPRRFRRRLNVVAMTCTTGSPRMTSADKSQRSTFPAS
jgi:hypothetical protein